MVFWIIGTCIVNRFKMYCKKLQKEHFKLHLYADLKYLHNTIHIPYSRLKPFFDVLLTNPAQANDYAQGRFELGPFLARLVNE